MGVMRYINQEKVTNNHWEYSGLKVSDHLEDVILWLIFFLLNFIRYYSLLLMKEINPLAVNMMLSHSEEQDKGEIDFEIFSIGND